jgi:hypothetical protein
MDDQHLNDDAVVARAATRLREEVPMRAAWRDDLLARVDEMGAPAPLSVMRASEDADRRWSVRPWVAIAASVALVAGGAALGAVLVGNMVPTGGAPSASPVATAAGARPAVVRVMYVAAGARQVSVVGDFNGWDPAASPLRRLADGRTWVAELPLEPGRYTYSFYVDGALEADPTAPRSADDFNRDGERASSVLMVRGS